jgi:hypothetical protein
MLQDERAIKELLALSFLVPETVSYRVYRQIPKISQEFDIFIGFIVGYFNLTFAAEAAALAEQADPSPGSSPVARANKNHPYG